MPLISKQCTVDSSSRPRLDQIVRGLTELSHREVRGLFDHGAVRLNGRVSDGGDDPVQIGDQVTVEYDPHQRYHEKPRAARGSAFRVVFEDRHLIVVEKAAMILTVPSDQGERSTLVQQIERYLGRGGPPRRVSIVHRLDRETSGLLVFGKDQATVEGLEEQFKAHRPERLYLALVAGWVERDQGTFDSFLTTGKSLTRYSTLDPRLGERAITHYRVEARPPGATFVEMRLETGRRNQIRAHFAEDGHPVVGDRRYRPRVARHPRWPHERLALHASVLGFVHPITKEALRYESRLPREFYAVLRGGGAARKA